VVYLVDTNVLLRYADRTQPLHTQVRAAIRKLRADGHHLRTTSQNFIEFWNVATRPVSRNGLGLSHAAAERFLRLLERIFPLLPDNSAIYPEWRNLVVTYGVSGVQVHDARLVAFMNVNGLTHILTYNIADFSRYAPIGIVAVDPATV
jgi:predicted nucleic acid-binding protein